jgi:hypothetical protein
VYVSDVTVDGGPTGGRGIEPTDPLFILYKKRLSYSYVVNDDGVRELRIDYGLKEISFDEERFFPFGEGLVRELTFTGERAMSWGPGYAWDEIRPLLESLIEEGVVSRSEVPDDQRGGGLVPSKLPPSVCPFPRSWSLAESEAITRDLGGRAVELGYLEAIIPAFRVAHPALDADDRQVGEGNVFPSGLRLDRETEWRVCQYPGSRYRDEMPMNVTALKAMIKYWKPMMTLTVALRSELQRRLGITHQPWTIGELHLMSCVVLCLPAYLLMKGGGNSPQQPLHPVLSSLFRITDGIRMTTSAMLFSIEHTRRADEPLTAAQLYTHVEQNAVFVGETGVCAGPKPLVDEFLATAIDGAPPEGIADLELPAEVREALAEVPAALDYAFLGMQSWGLSLSVWLAMSRAVRALLEVLEPAVGAAGKAAGATNSADPCVRLYARLHAGYRVLESLQINQAYDQEVHFKMYLEAYEPSWRGLRTPVGPPRLADAIAPAPEGPMHREAANQLRALLGPALVRGEGAGGGAVDVDRLVEVLVRYLRDEQGVLSSTEAIQAAINALLDRPAARRALAVRDFMLNYTLQSGVGSWPYLFDAIERELGVRVECTASAIDVSGRRPS